METKFNRDFLFVSADLVCTIDHETGKKTFYNHWTPTAFELNGSNWHWRKLAKEQRKYINALKLDSSAFRSAVNRMRFISQMVRLTRPNGI